jgi:Hemerythrin HHE cation binding domain
VIRCRKRAASASQAGFDIVIRMTTDTNTTTATHRAVTTHATPDLTITHATPDLTITHATPDLTITHATPDLTITHATPDLTITHATPDLTSYYAVHQAMRTSNEWLVAGIARAELGDRRRTAAIRRWYAGYAGELRNHHHNEDGILFPALLLRVPDFEVYDGGLANDHLRLDALIDGLDVALRIWDEQPASELARSRALDIANDLHDLLAEHLDIEDADVLPMFEQHMSAEEYARLDEQIMEDLDLGQALFTVPWFMTTIDRETAAGVLASAPVALWVLFRLTRRRYTRLARRAFG